MIPSRHFAEKIGICAGETVKKAGLTADQVDRVIFVGGSSLIGVVDRLMRSMFQRAAFEHSDVFSAVVDGLAIATGQDR